MKKAKRKDLTPFLTLRGVSAAQQLSNVGASVSITGGVSVAQSSSTTDAADAVTSSIKAGRDVELDADNDINIEGAKVAAENDVTLKAGNDVNIKSATNKYSSDSKSISASAGAGIGAAYNVGGGGSIGFRVQAEAAGAKDKSRAETHTNAEVTAGETLTVESGRDATVAGAKLKAKKIAMNVGRDLTVRSEQDKRAAAGSNWNIGGSATIGYGVSVEAHGGMGKSEADSAWVNQQTSIIGKEEVNIRVEKNTHIEGAVIAAENGNLKLDTDTLTYKDILDHDKAENWQASLSVSYSNEAEEKTKADADKLRQAGYIKEADKLLNDLEEQKKTNPDGTPTSKTLDASYDSKDREQINRATIGEGEIIIRSDPDAGLEGLNRDLAKAQEITKDEKTSVTVYVDKAAVKEVLSGFKGVQANAKKTATKVSDIVADLKGKTDLNADEFADFKGDITGLLHDIMAAQEVNPEQAEKTVQSVSELVAKLYHDLRDQGVSNSEALSAVEESIKGYTKSVETIGKNDIKLTYTSNGIDAKIPGIVTVALVVDDAALITSILSIAAMMSMVDTNTQLGADLVEGIKNHIPSELNLLAIEIVPGYADKTDQVAVHVADMGKTVAMDVVNRDSFGNPTLAKGELIIGDKSYVVYYDVTIDPATNEPIVSGDARVKQSGGGYASFAVDTIPDEIKEKLFGTPGYELPEDIDLGPDGIPGDTVVDNSDSTTPDNTGAVDSGTVSEDQSGLVDDSGIITSSSYTPEQLATAVKLGIDPKWVKPTGAVDWPKRNGFENGEYIETTLQPGAVIDRYGATTGNFLSPAGTPFEERALPASRKNETPTVYRVLKPLPVKEGKVEPWFDQVGRGTQFETEMTVQELLDDEYIEEVK